MSPCCDQSTQNQLTITNAGKEDPKLRGQKMEGDEGLNTVECLRGRLLAERQASRVANEEAESMGNKLVELEKKLRDEIELRKKAEKKLKNLKKKLQSLKLFPISEESVQLSSPEKSESSCCRSPASSSASRDSEAKTSKTYSSLSENTMLNVSEPSVPMVNGYDSQCSNNSDFSSHQNSNSQVLKNDESSSISRSSSKDSSFQDFNNDECRLSRLGSKSSVTEYEDDDRDYKIDNSLALVPVDFPITNKEARKVKPVHESVVEALDALRHAREKLLCSMGNKAYDSSWPHGSPHGKTREPNNSLNKCYKNGNIIQESKNERKLSLQRWKRNHKNPVGVLILHNSYELLQVPRRRCVCIRVPHVFVSLLSL